MRGAFRAIAVLGTVGVIQSAAAAKEQPKRYGEQDLVTVEESQQGDNYRKVVETPPGAPQHVRVSIEQKGMAGFAQLHQENERLRKELQASNQKLQSMELAQQKDIGVKHDERGTVLTLTGGVLFAFDSDKLLPSAERRLDTVAEVLKQNPPVGEKFIIEGHTDSKGSEQYNQELSERRAQSVKDYLVDRGVNADTIVTRGFGEEQPVAKNDSPEGRANNRRVEIVLPEEGATGIGGAGQGGSGQEKLKSNESDQQKLKDQSGQGGSGIKQRSDDSETKTQQKK